MNASPKPRVLVVDDIETNRYAFEAVLDGEFEVVLASSGKEALDQSAHQDFAVIVLDVRMPDMDGFETAEALRKRANTSVTPIVFTSAFEQTVAQMTRGYVSGATDFLFSPVDPDLLRLKVRTFAEIHLRHETMCRDLVELQQAVRSLHAELARRGMAITRVKARMESVEHTAQTLARNAAMAP